ncbi:pilus assembly PilX family protein [Wenzhouxiangella limi]|uniref:Type 4 fimbrial biogenesis protein PilX N-terminal domain-containing protein n=1 Tax=Wenzhouxiangella limi TaxID=2707351 RepID=A0A845UUP7_9GAMM|nr:PilX N-terminal domain-containing pilus assembly protein [Wenzhouxiangella limi]NDY94268.1 hypothetical protein [Wenzhouxiangella limi]
MNVKQFKAEKSKGVALVIALIILVVLTVLGVAMLNSSSLQERMSGNQKRIAESSMAAEGALQEHIGWLRADPDANWGAVHPSLSTFVSYGAGPNSRFIIDSWQSFTSPASSCSSVDSRCILNVRGQSFSGQDVLAETQLRAIVRYDSSLIPLGGDKDIWTNGTIRINGNAYLTNTYIHSDGNLEEVRITGGNTILTNSRVTANGTTNINLDPDGDTDRCIDCAIIEDAGLVLPPPNFVDRIETWRNEVDTDVAAGGVGEVTFTEINDQGVFEPYPFGSADAVPISNDINNFGGTASVNCNSASTYSLDLSNYSAGDVVFVNGNVSISGGGGNSTFENMTVIATCDMEHNGAIRQGGGGEVNNVFYAGGDMTFNGSTGNDPDTPFDGRFFAGGDMTQNGNSVLSGQIIMNGDLRLNGSFTFVGASSLGGGADTSTGTGEVVLLDWGQVWNS